jgi:hypothetical protein
VRDPTFVEEVPDGGRAGRQTTFLRQPRGDLSQRDILHLFDEAEDEVLMRIELGAFGPCRTMSGSGSSMTRPERKLMPRR